MKGCNHSETGLKRLGFTQVFCLENAARLSGKRARIWTNLNSGKDKCFF